MSVSAAPPPRADLPRPEAGLRGESRPATRDSRLAAGVAPYLVLALCSVVLFRDGLFGDAVFYQKVTVLFYETLGRWVDEPL